MSTLPELTDVVLPAALRHRLDRCTGRAGRGTVVLLRGAAGSGTHHALSYLLDSARQQNWSCTTSSVPPVHQPPSCAPLHRIAQRSPALAQPHRTALVPPRRLIAIEEVHHACPETVAEIHQLARELLADSGLLVLTCRTDIGGGPAGIVRDLLAGLPTSRLSRIELRPLDEERVAALLGAQLAGGIDAGQAARCRALTGGNPAVLRELVEGVLRAEWYFRVDQHVVLDLVAAAELRLSAGNPTLLPLRELGAQACQVAAAAASLPFVTGARLDAIARACRLPAAEVTELLEEFRVRGVLTGGAQPRFAIPLLRNTVAANLATATANELIPLAAREARDSVRGAARAEWADWAAQHSRALNRDLLTALLRTPDLHRCPPASRVPRLRALAEVAATGPDGVDDPPELDRTRLALVFAEADRGDRERLLTEGERLLRHGRDAGTCALAAGLVAREQVAAGQPELAEIAFVQLAGRLPSVELSTHRILVQANAGALAAAWSTLARDGRQTGCRAELAHWLAYRHGEPADDAEPIVPTGRGPVAAVVNALEGPAGRKKAASWPARPTDSAITPLDQLHAWLPSTAEREVAAAWQRDDWPAVLSLGRDTVLAQHTRPDRFGMAFVAATAAEVLTRRGQHSRAKAFLDPTRDLGVLPARLAWAEIGLHLLAGDLDRAEAAAAAGQRLAGHHRADLDLLLGRLVELNAEHDRAAARQALDRLTAVAEATGRPRAGLLLARATAMLSDNPEPARDALAAAQRHGTAFDVACARLLLAERGGEEATPDLDAAFATFDRLGATPWCCRVDARTADGARRTTVPDRDHLLLSLISDGFSNMQAAAVLRCGAKGVEHQLHRLYGKFDCHSRAELAARQPGITVGVAGVAG